MASEQTKEPEADMSWAELKAPLIRLALELGPLIVFFAVNTMGEKWLEQSPLLSSWFSQPIIFATAVFMVAMAISLLLSCILLKRVAVMPLVTGVVVAIFGTLTLVFQDATFIKMKPTIVNALFGAVLLGGWCSASRCCAMCSATSHKLKPEGWRRLTRQPDHPPFCSRRAPTNSIRRGAPMFTDSAKAADDFWVAFKVWGIMPLTVIFSMSQLGILKQFAPIPSRPTRSRRSPRADASRQCRFTEVVTRNVERHRLA